VTEVYKFSEPQLLLFFLVLVRMTAFIVSWPVFGVETISPPIKILFGLVLTILVFPTLHFSVDQQIVVSQSLLLMAAKEAVIGLLMGALARFFFFAFQIAGELISLSIGLSSAQMFNPALGGQASSIEQFYLAFATLFYLSVNGHHFLISGLVDSFRMVPISAELLKTGELKNISVFVGQVVQIGLQFSAPVLVSILTVNLVLGVVGKTVPQMNVLVTSFPVNILVGFAILILTLPLMLDEMGDFLEAATSGVFKMIRTF
jgi:flagellar biosynthetic protein FliR